MENYYTDLHKIKSYNKKANLIAHILRRNCLIQSVIKRNIYVTGRRGRRCKDLLYDLKETSVYWKLKEEAQGRTLWKLTMEEAVVRLREENESGFASF
jgi:hypothetical protein